jgi:putative transposase
MTEILPLLVCLNPLLTTTTARQLHQIVFALLCSPDRITMLGLSRWTEHGGSYRTIQRFYRTPINWAQLQWTLIRTHLLGSSGPYLLAGDEVVVSKAGKQTHGVGRFYSGLAQRVIPSVSFLTVSLIDVEKRQSYPLQTAQLSPHQATEQTVSTSEKRRPGRPKGRKNYEKPAPQLTPDLTCLQGMLGDILARISGIQVRHVLLDGKFGNYPATWMVRQTGLHIISKMRCNAALYRPYTGPKPRRGPTPRYGDKLDYAHLPSDACVKTVSEGDYRLDTYHLHLYHKDHPDLLNGVIIVKTHLKSGKRRHVVLFSTDTDLTAEQIVDYYSLRFQIEFNFRDAKQYWGLEDFMNVRQQTVTNAVNLAFFMVNFSALLRHADHEAHLSVLDLKARFRAYRYLSETIKLLPDPPDAPLIARIWQRLARFSAIRPPDEVQSAA